MFYELIYTRCRQGMDITKKGSQILSDGYKVYSCTPAILEESKIDIQFLFSAAQAKQSFTDPGLMDDAYLYYVPDTGPCYFVNFFPVPFDENATGDFSRRPGNFINHVFIGDFTSFYPYELFKDEKAWNAKTKGEAYYYENPPIALPERSDISDPTGQYSFDEIGIFIKDGREEALKKVVSFLISQYKEEPENRKYLVIKDGNSKNIELWIAAIQCAFSPKIASAVPFATRMDKFANTNKYTTKQGIYQSQINLQDPNHKHRYRAMIVGVDERDRNNVGLSKPLANSPFVLLDGKLKQAMFEADTSNEYFNLIVRFDDEHRDFCRLFLQYSNISNPAADISDFYNTITILTKPNLPGARILSDHLNKLSKYLQTNSSLIKSIYDNVNNSIVGFLQDDFSSGLNITNWLMQASKITGDNNAKQKVTEIICGGFIKLVFQDVDNNTKKENWSLISRSDFVVDVSNIIVNKDTIIKNKPNFEKFSSVDIMTFITIYLEAVSITDKAEQSDVLDYLVKRGCFACFKENNKNALKEIILIYSKKMNMDNQDLLLKMAKSDNKDYGKFMIEYLLTSDASIIASDKSMELFLDKLDDDALAAFKSTVVKSRIKNLNKISDIEAVIKISLEKSIKTNMLSEVFIVIKEKYGLDTFIECIIKMKSDDKEQLAVLNALFVSPEGYFSKYVEILISTANKNKDKWNAFCESVLKKKNDKMSDIIKQALTDTKQNEKTLKSLSGFLEDDDVRKNFDEISEKVAEKAAIKENKSIFGKLFGGKADSNGENLNDNKK